MFVQWEEIPEGLKVICWTTTYRYKQSGLYANLKRGVFKNGKRSTNQKYAEAIGKPLPKVLRVGIPHSKAYSGAVPHDPEEIKRILFEFPVSNEDAVTQWLNTHELYAGKLFVKERFGLDSLGVYLITDVFAPRELEINPEVDNFKIMDGPAVYHLRNSIISDATIAEARAGIKVRDTLDRKKAPIAADLTQIWITRQDSLNAGNCSSGTDHFIDSIGKGKFRITRIRADALLQLRNDKHTQVIIKLLTRKNKQK